jgi:hypothetical protein
MIDALEQGLETPASLIEEVDFDAPWLRLGVVPQALGLKSWRTFARGARCFNVRQEPAGALTLSEWGRRGDAFDARDSWTEQFPEGGMDLLAKAALARVSVVATFSKKTKRHHRRRARRGSSD